MALKQSCIKGLRTLAGLFVVLLGAAWATPAAAQDPSFLSFSVGYFDFNRQKDTAAEVGVQYRAQEKLWIFQPMAGGMVTSDGAANVYAGISLDIFFGNRIVLRPSFAPGLYFKGSGHDLGHVVEFRSGVELAYRFDNRARLGLEIYHLSNAHLADENPGEETIALVYSIPTSSLFGQ